MLDFMESYDALLSPVAPYVAPLHGTTFDEEKLRGANPYGAHQ
jgi:Asp-tRNA(Asn)/Glu-tRNA(Gln) amidotransferase A subunit family amidase